MGSPFIPAFMPLVWDAEHCLWKGNCTHCKVEVRFDAREDWNVLTGNQSGRIERYVCGCGFESIMDVKGSLQAVK
jgi:hypothetical protein